MPHPAGIDDFNFSLVGADKFPFIGYISAQDPTKTDLRAAIQGSKNVYLKDTGTWSVRPGLKLIGAIDSTEDGVVASYEFEVVSGMTLPIRVLESGKFQFEYQGTWYTLTTFANTDFIFTTWWDDANKLETIVMVNGDSNLYQWNAAITFFSTSNAQANSSVVSTSVGGGSIVGSYQVGDILTLVGGNNDAKVKVTQVGGGAPLAIELMTTGSGYAIGNVATTAGSLSGATGETINIVRVADTYTLTNNQGMTWAQLGFNTTDNTGDLTSVNNNLVLDGVEYTYFGGTSTTTLNNVFPTVAGGAPPIGTSGDIIYQQIRTVSGTPTGTGHNDFVLTLNNQLIVGSYTSKVIYISADDDFTDFTNTGDLVRGDPDFVILGEFPTGGVVKGDSAYVFAGNSNDYIITPNTPSGDSSGVVYTDSQKQVGAGKSAAINQNFITSFGEDILYLSQDHQLRKLGTLRNIVTQKSPSLSKAVRQELIDEDFTGGALRAVDEFVYITAPISGRTYIYQVRDDVDNVGNLTATRFWLPYQEWDISRIAVIDGVVAGYSAEFPQLYQLWDTGQYHDDNPSGTGAPYTAVLRMAYRQFNERDDLGSFDKVYYEGYILPNSDLTANIYNDYQGATALQTKVISSTDVSPVMYGGDGVTTLGGNLIGSKTIGGGFPLGDYVNPLPKFRIIANVRPEDCFEYCLELFSEKADSQWEAIAFGPDIALSLNKPVNLQL